MPKIKARCSKYNKWFVLELIREDGVYKINNFVDISEDQSKGISTEIQGSSFVVADNLLPCVKCGTRKAGTCNHIEDLGMCKDKYSFQCLYCNRLRIDLGKATTHYTEWAGTNLIPGAKYDQYGNAVGSQYDLAKDRSFCGFKIVILCLYTGEGILV